MKPIELFSLAWLISLLVIGYTAKPDLWVGDVNLRVLSVDLLISLGAYIFVYWEGQFVLPRVSRDAAIRVSVVPLVLAALLILYLTYTRSPGYFTYTRSPGVHTWMVFGAIWITTFFLSGPSLRFTKADSPRFISWSLLGVFVVPLMVIDAYGHGVMGIMGNSVWSVRDLSKRQKILSRLSRPRNMRVCSDVGLTRTALFFFSGLSSWKC